MKGFLLIIALLAPCSCFVGHVTSRRAPWTLSQKSLFPDSVSTLIATIDADIAKIPENEFAPVFMGGVVVMFGGVIASLIVGTILEKGDLYASVVADSYVQQGNDEEFWKGLSEEERIKGKDILKEIEARKNGEQRAAEPAVAVIMSSVGAESSAEPKDDKPKKEVDMFSDYD